MHTSSVTEYLPPRVSCQKTNRKLAKRSRNTTATNSGGAGAARAVPPRLDEAKIVDAALAIIDARGLSALSMRALGTDVGTSAMALYFHFSDKEALLSAVARRLSAMAPALHGPVAPARPEDGAAHARAILADLRAVHARHPKAFALVQAEIVRECATTAGKKAWATRFPSLSPPRAELLRIAILGAASEPASLDAELCALFFGYSASS